MTADWLAANKETLNRLAGNDLAIIVRPGRKRIQIEVPCRSAAEISRLRKLFGGSVRRLPPNRLKRYTVERVEKSLKVGRRLIILNVGGTSVSRQSPRRLRHGGPSHIFIPAGVAFGTGQHATTAMSLRILERVTRSYSDWSLLDLGTGSGVFTLAAKALGATMAVGIDNDPIAISTARANAKLNRLRGIDFRLADIARRPPGKFEVVMANLFSELLIQLLPRLKHSLKGDGHLILSGILRSQENDVRRGLRSNRFQIVEARRRGKWVALLCR